jgi:hypothetical protein
VFDPLSAADFESFLDRFGRFCDAVLREVFLEWKDLGTCTLVTEAREGEEGWTWRRVTLRITQVRAFSWSSHWQGLFGCAELVLVPSANGCFVAVTELPGEGPEQFSARPDDFFMIVEGQHVEVEIGNEILGVTKATS